MTSKPELTFYTPDSRGISPRNFPNALVVGQTYQHQGNHKFYRVTGICWNGEDDTWMIQHQEVEGAFKDAAFVGQTTFVRTPHNFCGLMSNGGIRFVRVH